ncbi:hypothetical protein MJT46_000363 [Ovis ammon polii x Ovis aries]|nr:hypothetical protein MJT46_000363 [Ovis ammon polii x Ovis aries]
MKCANELTWQESLESCSLNGKNDLGSSGTHFCKEEKEFIPPYWLFIFVFLNLKQTFERSFLVYQKTGICLRLTLKNGKDEERRGTGKGAVTLKLPLNIQLSSTTFTVSEQNVQYVDHNHRSVHTHYLKNFHKPNRWTEDQRSEIISANGICGGRFADDEVVGLKRKKDRIQAGLGRSRSAFPVYDS